MVPEIDLPGHTNAALVAYPELAPDKIAPPPYTGTEVGFSYVDPADERTYDFVADVLGELAALTPGPWLHIGGDEAFKVKGEVYTGFVERAQRIVADTGKSVVGWHQLAPAAHIDGRVLQWWGTDADDPTTADAVRRGARLIVSPGNHAYLDMKYAPDTPIGHDWAGLIDVRRAYDWDPGTHVAGVPDRGRARRGGPALDRDRSPRWPRSSSCCSPGCPPSRSWAGHPGRPTTGPGSASAWPATAHAGPRPASASTAPPRSPGRRVPTIPRPARRIPQPTRHPANVRPATPRASGGPAGDRQARCGESDTHDPSRSAANRNAARAVIDSMSAMWRFPGCSDTASGRHGVDQPDRPSRLSGSAAARCPVWGRVSGGRRHPAWRNRGPAGVVTPGMPPRLTGPVRGGPRREHPTGRHGYTPARQSTTSAFASREHPAGHHGHHPRTTTVERPAE